MPGRVGRGDAGTGWIPLGDLYVRTDRLAKAEAAYAKALDVFQKVEARIGEANTRKALGDLYVCTDRLAEAEAAYAKALDLFQKVEDRLGEANALIGIGNLAFAQQEPALAWRAYRAALAIQQDIQDRLGMAASLGHMARAAQAIGDLECSVLLAGASWLELEQLDNAWGQVLNLLRLLSIWQQRQDGQRFVATAALAWKAALRAAHPAAQGMEQTLRAMLPHVDLTHPDPLLGEARSILMQALAETQERIQVQGVDLFSDLLPGE